MKKSIKAVLLLFLFTLCFTLPVHAAKPGQTISLSNITKHTESSGSYIKARVTYGNTSGKLTYKISDSSIAYLSSDGYLVPYRVGTATITVTAPGNSYYARTSKKVKLTVNPAPTVVTSLSSPGRGKMNVKWRSKSGISGYQIRYGTSSGFYSAKTASIKAGSNSYTRNDVASGYTYYVGVRTFKDVGGKRYYSSWSGTKSVLIKTSTPTPAAKDISSVINKPLTQAASALGLKHVAWKATSVTEYTGPNSYVRTTNRFYTANGSWSSSKSYMEGYDCYSNVAGKWNMYIKDSGFSVFGVKIGMSAYDSNRALTSNGWRIYYDGLNKIAPTRWPDLR